MIRHYDQLKYTCWTVYIAIFAGLYAAKSYNEINNGIFVVLVGIESLYFIFLLTRIQKNYKNFCLVAEEIEIKMKEDEVSERKFYNEKFVFGPFEYNRAILPGFFNKKTPWEKIFGSIPYFILHIGFFIAIFISVSAMYFFNDPKLNYDSSVFIMDVKKDKSSDVVY